MARGAEADASYYSAFISHAAGGTVYRAGNLHVTAGGTPGLSVTKPADGSSTWAAAVPAAGRGAPATLQPHPDGGFVSLIPASADGNLDPFKWSAGRDAPRTHKPACERAARPATVSRVSQARRRRRSTRWSTRTTRA